MTVEHPRRRADDKAPWVMRTLHSLPAVFVVCIPLFTGAVAFMQSHIDASDLVSETKYREEFVLTKTYVAEQKAAEEARVVERERLKRIEEKVDRILEKR